MKETPRKERSNRRGETREVSREGQLEGDEEGPHGTHNAPEGKRFRLVLGAVGLKDIDVFVQNLGVVPEGQPSEGVGGVEEGFSFAGQVVVKSATPAAESSPLRPFSLQMSPLSPPPKVSWSLAANESPASAIEMSPW
jgi:hypothetical protein